MWEILKGEELHECLDCGHESSMHAENDEYVVDKETDEREVFCPNCHSAFYYHK